MARNVEIKARLPDGVDALRPRAQALADGPPQPIVQDDTFFVVPHGRLKLRDFGDGTGELIAYQRADDSGPKLSDYVRAPTTDPAALREALARACGVLGRVRKQRTLLLAGATRIHLDRVERLGDFLELEVVLREDQSADEGEAVARDLLARLGVDPAQLVAGAYLDLLRGADAEAATASSARNAGTASAR